MNLAELVSQVQSAGGAILPDGSGGLRLRAPCPLPDALVAELRAHRDELLVALAPELAEAVEELKEYWSERAGILEHYAHLPRRDAEEHAAAMTATLARNRAYPWRALRLALASRPDLAAEVPDTLAPTDRLLWGPARLAIIPGRRVVPQGVHQGPTDD
ncbi:hypothetical protein BMS3Abin12_00008 [bacterium BMS3Abin12]|nr:hypothetical protein BMS3Abin12_00008 [bacterium BMS3Abin12]